MSSRCRQVCWVVLGNQSTVDEHTTSSVPLSRQGKRSSLVDPSTQVQLQHRMLTHLHVYIIMICMSSDKDLTINSYERTSWLGTHLHLHVHAYYREYLALSSAYWAEANEFLLCPQWLPPGLKYNRLSHRLVGEQEHSLYMYLRLHSSTNIILWSSPWLSRCGPWPTP